MRWKYLIPRIVIVALIWGFFAWAFDPILRIALAKTGRQLNGAQVDVAGLETTFFPPAVELTHVQIADKGKPGRNLVEFESFRLQLAGGPLAHRKLVIEEGTITGLAWNTPRSDSGELAEGDSFRLGDQVPLDELRKKISELGKTWLKEALGAAKSRLDPQQLETVRVSTALKDQWLARFQMYEARLKNIEDRVKGLKDGVKVSGNAIQQIEAYRLAAIEVRKLLEEARKMRQELSTLGQTANADLRQIELARQRDLESIQHKLEILKFDKQAISEGLLGPEVLTALEEAMHWVTWTKDNLGRLTAAREPARGRGLDVAFAKPDDPHPDFLIRKLLVSGRARVNGEMLPYAGTLSNVTSDPKRWGRPTVLEITTEGAAKIHLTATIDRTAEEPVYEMTVEYRLQKPIATRLGDAEKLAFVISADETLWNAHLKLAGDHLSGQVTFRQENVRIEPESRGVTVPVQVAAIEPVRFEWDPEQELERALSGVFSQVHELEATVEVAGAISHPEWKFSSNLGPQVAAGVESYLAAEMARRKSQLAGEVEQLAGEQIASFREALGEKFRVSSGRLNLTETEANELIQKFAGRPLDVRGFFK